MIVFLSRGGLNPLVQPDIAKSLDKTFCEAGALALRLNLTKIILDKYSGRKLSLKKV
jgi:hypothetical protein